jgi:hypothetical protein
MSLLTIVALAALLVPPQDPVTVTASLTADRVAVGERTTLRITVETRGAAPDAIDVGALPAGLEVVATSDYSQTQISMPGGRSRMTRRELVLVARAPGSYRVPAATIVVAGSTYRTAALELVVTGTARPAPPRVDDEFDDAPQLRLWAQPDTVFVGQQVMLFAEATFAGEARTRRSRPAMFDPPAPSGFWLQDVPDPVSVTLRVRDGRTVETQTFRRALFPLDHGAFTIPPARLHYEVRRGFLFAPESRQVASDSLRLVVLPLPPQGQPAGFTGAVGRLSLRASVAPDRVRLGEETVVTVEIRGRGNVKALPEPHLPALEHAEIFAPTQDSDVDVAANEVGGSKRFRWVIVPERAGTLTIPPIEYSVFDPELRQYVTLLTDTLRVHAQPIAGTDVSPADTALRPLRAVPGREPAGWARGAAFAGMQAVPLLIVAAVTAVRRRRERPPGPREHHRRLRAELERLRSGVDTGGGPGAGAARGDRLAALERWLADAVVSLTGAAPGDPVAALRAQGRAAQADALAALLADARRLRFAPGARDAVAEEELLRRAGRIADELAPRRRFRRTAALVLCVMASSVHAIPARAEAISFEQAAARYSAGDYAGAATAFHDYARARPGDPTGWYNHGLAAYEAGDPGRAVWAWLRAAQLAPRDADIRHNLRVAGADDALAVILPPDRLARGERLALAAAAWWVLVLGLGLRRRRAQQGRGAVLVAVAALLLLAAVAGAEASIATRPAWVTPLGSGATLHAGPNSHDEMVGELAVGGAARVVERRVGWLLVRTKDDRTAWVERAAVAAP